ncbi:MAG: cation/acetate symporter ActP [Sphingomonadales bacterium]
MALRPAFMSALIAAAVPVGLCTLTATPAHAAAGADQPLNFPAISMFALFVATTLIITYWASRRTTTAEDFYSAGKRISGTQNGLAIAGDFMSAATFLGMTGLLYAIGFDTILYFLSAVVGFSLMLFVIAEPLRNLGRFTFADVVSYRLEQRPVRTLTAFGTLAVVTMYMIAQIVGAGTLVQILFGLPYNYAVVLVGVLMVLYVTFGGMIATTWVQIIKAALLLTGVTVLSFLVMAEFGFSFENLLHNVVATHAKGKAVLAPGGLFPDPISAISLAMGLTFGFLGLPHVLMRLFTVPDVKEARRSMLVATGIIGYVIALMFFVVGFGAIVLVSNDSQFVNEAGRLVGGNNMAAVHLSKVVGGDLFLGFISAVTFATILAVVAGLTLAGASAISHDLYANVFRGGKASEKNEVRVSRIATIVIGAISIGLGILFEGENVIYLAGLALAVAASANFPVLILSIYWRGLTTRGAITGGYVGLVSAVGLVIVGPTVWVHILGNAEPLWPYKDPALFSVTLAFATAWLFSVTDKSARATSERAAFNAQYIRSQTGLGADAAELSKAH